MRKTPSLVPVYEKSDSAFFQTEKIAVTRKKDRADGEPRNKLDAQSDGSVLNSGSSLNPMLLRADEAAKLLGLGTRTLWRHANSGLAPPPVRIGGSVRFRKAELEAWVAAGCPSLRAREREQRFKDQ